MGMILIVMMMLTEYNSVAVWFINGTRAGTLWESSSDVVVMLSISVPVVPMCGSSMAPGLGLSGKAAVMQ